MHYLERRQVLSANELLEFPQPGISANLIRNAHIERWIVRTGVRVQSRLDRMITGRLILILPRRRLANLAIVAQSDPLFDGGIPKVSQRGFIHVSPVITVTPRGISRRCGLLPIVRNIAASAPHVSLRTDFGVDEEAVK